MSGRSLCCHGYMGLEAAGSKIVVHLFGTDGGNRARFYHLLLRDWDMYRYTGDEGLENTLHRSVRIEWYSRK